MISLTLYCTRFLVSFCFLLLLLSLYLLLVLVLVLGFVACLCVSLGMDVYFFLNSVLGIIVIVITSEVTNNMK